MDNILNSLNDKQKKQLDTYYKMLVATNEKFNLTSITDREDVYIKHFADSIMGHTAIPTNATVVDIGSGAGFPGIPLKIYRNDIKLTLVDSLNKRINFTTEVANVLDINITCIHSRAEDFAVGNRQKYDVATARAVAPLPILLEYTAPLVTIGGIVLAYKTDTSEVDQCSNACLQLGLEYSHCTSFCLPNGDNRALLIFNKVVNTPTKYPRGGNKPRKQPL